MKGIKRLAVEALTSKKVMALFIAVLANIAALAAPKFGVAPEQAAAAVTRITAALATYIVGQGIADHGKEAAKIQMEQKDD